MRQHQKEKVKGVSLMYASARVPIVGFRRPDKKLPGFLEVV